MNSSNYFDHKPSFLDPQVTQHGSHMVMSPVMKELKTKKVALDTKFSEEYHNLNLANCTFALPERITNVHSISVSSVQLPLTFYNISAQMQNNSFVVVYNKTAIDIIIPDGNYTLITLSQVINNALSASAVSGILSFAFLPEPMIGFSRFTFTLTNNLPITLFFNIDASGNMNRFDFKSRLGWILGFRRHKYELKKSSILTSEGMVNLKTTKYVFLVLEEFSTASHSSSFHSMLPHSLMNKNIIAQVAIDSNGVLGGYQNATLYNGLLVSDTRQFYGDCVDLLKCQVQIVNEFGRIISFNANDFSFVLEFKHY